MSLSTEQRNELSSYYLKTAWLGESPTCNLSSAARAALDPTLYRYSWLGRAALAVRGYTMAHPHLSRTSDSVTSLLENRSWISEPPKITPPGPLRIDREYRVFQHASQVATKLTSERRHAKWEGETRTKPLSTFANTVTNAPEIPAISESRTLVHEGRSFPMEVACTQGRKKVMEDEYLARTFQIQVPSPALPQFLNPFFRQQQDVTVFGMFDGHTGRETCTTLKKQLIHRLKYYLETWALTRHQLDDVAIFNALKLTCVDLGHRVSGVDGSCAAIAVVVNENLWIANTGDSRVVLDNGGEMEQLSRDAKPEHPEFLKRILKRGSLIAKTRGIHRILYRDANGKARAGLAPAGSIGDHRMVYQNQTLCNSARPKIVKVPLPEIKPGSRLILATDGLWDVATSQEVVDARTNAMTLISGAYHARSLKHPNRPATKDNISAMMVHLGHRP